MQQKQRWSGRRRARLLRQQTNRADRKRPIARADLSRLGPDAHLGIRGIPGIEDIARNLTIARMVIRLMMMIGSGGMRDQIDEGRQFTHVAQEQDRDEHRDEPRRRCRTRRAGHAAQSTGRLDRLSRNACHRQRRRPSSAEASPSRQSPLLRRDRSRCRRPPGPSAPAAVRSGVGRWWSSGNRDSTWRPAGLPRSRWTSPGRAPSWLRGRTWRGRRDTPCPAVVPHRGGQACRTAEPSRRSSAMRGAPVGRRCPSAPRAARASPLSWREDSG